ncbi:LysR substrate-binding domain-containing protein [Burkholderia ubonensis]|uniref:LysR substrate-binding domain-containing protein n=1 Tax=Burkholderia ubonensis TaxID=101571 RepID=UPI000752A579|nr:LysR substrate-binding domain-containing protein [Burkholderia ubonensis]KVC86012.1 hypothetical protein WI75_33060 [Burkholderia ubonensis]KVZ43785.1 hypothetical protein WL18_15220 [Burkholderia ubonensis]
MIANVALSVVVFTAMFTACTCLADLLERVAHVPPARVGWWLMGFGAVGLAGNWLGGRYVDRHPAGATAVFVLLLDFAERHPRLKLHASFTDRFVDPVEEGIDVAVRIGSVEFLFGVLAHRAIGRDRVIFCAAPRHLQQRPAIREAADLERHDCVTYGRADGSVSPWVMARPNGQIERRPMNGRIVVGSGEAQLQAVKAGYGIAQLATWMIYDALRSGELVDVLPACATAGLPVNLIWARHRERLPKVGATLEFLDHALRAVCAEH